MFTALQRIQRYFNRPAQNLLGSLVVAGGLLLGGACFVKALPDPGVRGDSSIVGVHQDARSNEIASLAYRTKNIEDVRVGDRVLADDPHVNSTSETQVSPTTWRKLRLRAETRWDDGTLDDINVETLQPLDWIHANGASVGVEARLPLDLLEMGLPEELKAEVIAVDPCPEIQRGLGRVVLTTVDHFNCSVRELTVRGVDATTDTIRPTSYHKFYRATDDAWVSAEDLRPGDVLQGLAGAVTVLSNERVPGTHRVYNLTVEGEHVYNVAQHGVLVHNNKCAAAKLHGNSLDYPGPTELYELTDKSGKHLKYGIHNSGPRPRYSPGDLDEMGAKPPKVIAIGPRRYSRDLEKKLNTKTRGPLVKVP